MRAPRPVDAIDIVKLLAQGSNKEWNAFLTNCYQKHDLEKLALTRRRLQAGMAIASKKKLNSEKVIALFIRLQNSLENEIKKIIREKYPNPCDNPMLALSHSDARAAKKRRDNAMEKYLRDNSY